MQYPDTPDGRYFLERGRFWRRANPALSPRVLKQLTSELMAARRAVGRAKRHDDPIAMKAARADVDATKIALGEREPPWWSDCAPDFNRHLAKNTPYAECLNRLARPGTKGQHYA